MTELEKIALRDTLRQSGLSERKIEDVFLLLSFKPERVQLAFYYVATGNTHEYAAEQVGVSRVQIGKYISRNCGDIKGYLEQLVTI